ncbi:hypothetical protein ACQE3E_12785 [Methylomonas sp. MED-D]|uniref:Uncharacterized protein n=1 Tax=Methylomonas koyamae TaxID=702114 RepID=A0A177NDT3_9GAMM|nr:MULTISPECIES: hypothetical protein [Methylomonas]NJA05098.1 hypothetical protein [Methylococcaceae bacterium WWC4]MDT4331706.1 hypothetical protein [Methylomonas sp. MV1]OAI15982.1 hypothetical protein A1355_10250 [Methylomonas koyamae]OHX36889.1 hypothetical protein BJL95_19500 [Methylomonas sp. LWB]WGS84156.1 hypothetical protein QC632_13955 [Methylomonas sp. UP202]
METFSNDNLEFGDTRTDFIEMLSHQFVSMTGCGVYVYLNPLAINSLYNQYLSESMPIRTFARQCVKDLL